MEVPVEGPPLQLVAEVLPVEGAAEVLPFEILCATRSRRGRFVYRVLGLVDLHSESVEWNFVDFHWICIP